MIRKTFISIIGISVLLSFSAEAGNRHGNDRKHHKKHHHAHQLKHHDRHYQSRRNRHHGCRHEDHYQYARYQQVQTGVRFDVNLGYGYAPNGAVIYIPPRVHVEGVIGY